MNDNDDESGAFQLSICPAHPGKAGPCWTDVWLEKPCLLFEKPKPHTAQQGWAVLDKCFVEKPPPDSARQAGHCWVSERTMDG